MAELTSTPYLYAALKITGIGGMFIKAKHVKSLAAWYQKQLGIEFGNNSYVDFKCPPEIGTAGINKNFAVPGHTVFSLFKENTMYFSPAEKPFMINSRVNDLDGLLDELQKDG
ncbi:MAG: hypothetical protein JWO92_1406 [Chitinophagaceae bacterium]|nr:hypothetical protein [Chitinophagaceae bacterium]MDB5223261.1 hypothetical protein [Chitinophagaceae bacterium]